jgi:hypothetical protein
MYMVHHSSVPVVDKPFIGRERDAACFLSLAAELTLGAMAHPITLAQILA